MDHCVVCSLVAGLFPDLSFRPNSAVFSHAFTTSQVNASDADVGRNAEITYAMADLDLQPADSQGQGQGQGRQLETTKDGDAGLCVDKFHIDAHTGVVTAKTPLDYEQRPVYKCRVLAVDAGTPPNTGQAKDLHCIRVQSVSSASP